MTGYPAVARPAGDRSPPPSWWPTSRRSCVRSSSRWPRRGGSRTPTRRPRPTNAAPRPSSPGASSSPIPSAVRRRCAPRSTRCRVRTIRCSAVSSTCCTTASSPTRSPPTCAERSWSSRRASSRRSTTSAASSTAGASTTTRSPRSCAPATTSTNAAPRGRRRSRSVRRSRIGSASWPAFGTRPRRRSGPATTSPSRSPPASSTRTASSPPSTTSTVRPRPPFAAWKHDDRRTARDAVRLPRRRPAALALRRPVLPGASCRGCHLDRPLLHRRRPRGAHRSHLRRPRPRRGPDPRMQ